MFITRTKCKLFLLTFLANLQLVWASGDGIPKVSQKPILFDSFVFTSLGGHINKNRTFLSGSHHFNSIASNSGVGIGFHTPKEKSYTQLHIGYQYMPYAYAGGQLITNPIHTYWVNVDLNQEIYGILLGIQSSIRVKRELELPLSDQYVGITNDCFNNATIALYTGVVFPILPNFLIQLRLGGYIISPINDKIVMRNMMSADAKSSKLYFEGRLVYRIFTTGRKNSYY